ncbi:MAG: hypothetical protein RRA35_02050 [Desulfomonilia bacterium]|nr:hypothetical protein [Desulfomonilia bacterium]
MTRILKALHMIDQEQVTRICAHYFVVERGFEVLEYHLGNLYTGSIDLLAAHEGRIYLIFINTANFSDTLVRSLTGYQRFMQNREFLARAYGGEHLDFTQHPVLAILSPSFPGETALVVQETLRIPVECYRYLLFGSQSNPELFVEALDREKAEPPLEEVDLGALRTNLHIEDAGLSDEDILDFLERIRA